jgi:stage II sporulation protein D
MRHVVLVSFLVALVVSAAQARPAALPSAPVFVLTGGGWGHGVGMSQWGAYGQALEGRTATEILAVYYPGTTLEQSGPRTVRVLLRSAVAKLTVSSATGVRVRDAAGAVMEVPAGDLVLDPSLTVEVDGASTPLRSPLTISAVGAGTLGLGDRSYRGQLVVTTTGARLQVVNRVGLEQYLQGVVSGEMPKGWPIEALKAQAIAARTYALATAVKGKPFDLYSDWRSQVYYGAAAESAATTKAVRETRGLFLSFGGKPAQTLYFSSSGGRTRSALDVFGNEVPYLRAVDDPWDAVPDNPNHRWKPQTIPARKLAAAVRLGTPASDVVATIGGDGRPVTLAVTSASGATRTVTARDARTLLGLRSTSFRLGVLRLAAPADTVAGEPVALEGVARDVDAPALERQAPDGAWRRVRPIAPKPDGSFRVVVRPQQTTVYRLVAGDIAGPAVTVSVTEAE